MNTNRGYIVIFLTLIFSLIVSLMVMGASNPVINHYRAIQAFQRSNQAYMAANSSISEILYKLRKGWTVNASETLSLGTASSSISTNTVVNKTIIIATASSSDYIRTVKMELIRGTGISFFYGIQSGQGGFVMQNSSTVTGNVFSSGTVVGAGNLVSGDVVSAGPTGLIDGIHSTGNALAHTIRNSTVDKDAFYAANNLTNTTVSGATHPNSTDQQSQPYPISDAQIDAWEYDAEHIVPGGHVETCTNGKFDVNAGGDLGPARIPCDLNINGTAGGYTVNIKGPIWVEGNITISQKATIAMDPGLQSNNVAIIADNKSNPSNSGIITLSNKASFQGSGAAGSYVFMISQNNSAETGGSTNALNVGQSSNALVGYALHGQITLGQSVSLKEVTAYKIILTQTANVTYDTGLPSTVFQSGPSGGYDILDWYEF